MSMAQIGGGYGALMGKKKKGGGDKKPADGAKTGSAGGGAQKAAKEQRTQPQAPRQGKVVSLKESEPKEKKEAPAKKEEPAAKQTKAEEKKAREAKDRHEQRGAASPGRGGAQKGDMSPTANAADAALADADAAAELTEEQQEKAAREQERRAKEEEEERQKREAEERQITYEEFQEKQKDAKPVVATLAERKVDDKAFKKFTQVVKAEDEDPFGGFKKKKEAAPAPVAKGKAKPAAKKGGKPDPKPAPKAAKPKYQDLTKELVQVTVTTKGKGDDGSKGKGKGGGKGKGEKGGKGKGPVMGSRGPSEWDQESRVDPADGETRTKREFVNKYSGFTEWDAAARQAAPAGDDDAAPKEEEPESW